MSGVDADVLVIYLFVVNQQLTTHDAVRETIKLREQRLRHEVIASIKIKFFLLKQFPACSFILDVYNLGAPPKLHSVFLRIFVSGDLKEGCFDAVVVALYSNASDEYKQPPENYKFRFDGNKFWSKGLQLSVCFELNKLV